MRQSFPVLNIQGGEKSMQNHVQKVFRYHEETKHHFHRFARSSGYMDWKNQPGPFRFYGEKKALPLPLLKKDPPAAYRHLYEKTEDVRPFTEENIGGFLELSLGLSAWKSAGNSRRALRMNPSSGNLHPTEAHLLLPAMEKSASGIYHYNPLLHALEPRAELREELWEKIRKHFQTEIFFIALGSIFWRESWKYGERALRYCLLDSGHALAALRFSANIFGWKLSCLSTLSDADTETLLGFDRMQWHETEAEFPEVFCAVHAGEKEIPRQIPDDILHDFSLLSFGGKTNALSSRIIRWNLIYDTARSLRKPRTAEPAPVPADIPFRCHAFSAPAAAEIIRRRRSALSFSGNVRMNTDDFLAILDKCLPRSSHSPFDAESGPSHVNLLLFVHSVAGLERGMYFFLRTDHPEKIRACTDPDLLWEQKEKDFPLYLLQKGDFREKAIRLSCNQGIAGYSIFSLGMIAVFRSLLEKEAFQYRKLFRECGMIGQVLYLEAAARGLRGTGIGCYYDDPVHECLSLPDNEFQSLYHFTLGHAVEDKGPADLPPYEHLKTERDGKEAG